MKNQTFRTMKTTIVKCPKFQIYISTLIPCDYHHALVFSVIFYICGLLALMLTLSKLRRMERLFRPDVFGSLSRDFERLNKWARKIGLSCRRVVSRRRPDFKCSWTASFFCITSNCVFERPEIPSNLGYWHSSLQMTNGTQTFLIWQPHFNDNVIKILKPIIANKHVTCRILLLKVCDIGVYYVPTQKYHTECMKPDAIFFLRSELNKFLFRV